MSAARRRLFLSHGTTKAADERAWLAAVVSVLEAAGFDVFEYRRDLESGPAWRSALWQALLNCDGAVVLRTGRAAKRRWVRYETEVLQARAQLEPGLVFRELQARVDAAPASWLAPVVVELGAAAPLHARQPWEHPTVGAGEIDEAGFKACLEAFVVRARIAAALHRWVSPVVMSAIEPADADQRSPQLDVALDRLPQLRTPAGRRPGWPDTLAPCLAVAEGVMRDPFRLTALQRHLPPATLAGLAAPLAVLAVPAAAAQAIAPLFGADPAVATGAWRLAIDDTLVAQWLVQRAWGIERFSSGAPLVVIDAGELFEPAELVQEVLRRWNGYRRRRFDADDQNATRPAVIVPALAVDDALVQHLQLVLPGCVVVACGRGGDVGGRELPLSEADAYRARLLGECLGDIVRRAAFVA